MAGQVVIKMVGENADLRAKLGQTTKEVAKLEKQLEKTKSKSHNAFGGLKDSVASTIPGLGKLKGKFEEAGHAQGGFTSKIEGSVGSLGGLSAGIAGVGAAAAVGLAAFSDFAKEAVSDTLDLAGATKKLSRETGLDTQAASAWVSLAKERGINTQKLSMDFSSLSKAMYAAGHGGAKFADLLDSVGVSQAAINNGDLGGAINSIADSFEKMKDGPGKTAIALKLFGKGGKDMIPILNQGSKGIKEMQGEMAAMGLTLNKKTIKAFSDLKPAMRTIKGSFEGLKIQLGQKIIPWLAKTAKAFALLITQLQHGKKPTGELGRAFETASKIFKVTMTVLNVLWGVFRTVFSYIQGAVGIVTSAFQGKWARMWGYVKQVAGAFFRVVTTPMRLAFGVIVQIAGSIASRVWGAMRGALSAIGRFGSGVAGSVRGALGGILGTIGSIPGRLMGLAGRFAHAGVSLGRSFINSIGSGLSATGHFLGNLGRSIANWINDHTLFGDKISLGPISVKIPALAHGGIVNGATLAMVGEAGPEAVIPLSPGRRSRGIDLYRQAGAALGLTPAAGGGSNTFVVNNYGNQLDERALAARLAWQMQTRTA